ncbi:MAG: AbrB/MazE/SpoVT family DNA-binding domain-containing protein [Acidimicrobiales bacterium]|jgi:AbrB family looped-hinge helix DNA binding protein
MPTSKVTSKGQITIPAEVRRRLALVPGSRVNFVPLDNGSYEFVPATGTVTSLKGCVRSRSTPVTLEEMDDAIAAGAATGLAR